MILVKALPVGQLQACQTAAGEAARTLLPVFTGQPDCTSAASSAALLSLARVRGRLGSILLGMLGPPGGGGGAGWSWPTASVGAGGAVHMLLKPIQH